MDTAGNLYGTAFENGAYGHGSVFKLTRWNSGWIYTTLHDFNGSDGRNPESSLIFDANGNLFGTTAGGGAYDKGGVVFEITP